MLTKQFTINLNLLVVIVDLFANQLDQERTHSIVLHAIINHAATNGDAECSGCRKQVDFILYYFNIMFSFLQRAA